MSVCARHGAGKVSQQKRAFAAHRGEQDRSVNRERAGVSVRSFPRRFQVIERCRETCFCLVGQA